MFEIVTCKFNDFVTYNFYQCHNYHRFKIDDIKIEMIDFLIWYPPCLKRLTCFGMILLIIDITDFKNK